MIPSRTVNGTLYEYLPKKYCFEFGNVKSENVLIFAGGLGDKIATIPYSIPLYESLKTIGWSLINFDFSSSGGGWGTGSLERDFQEISKLVEFLKSKEGGSRKKIGLMGHSTGCQNTMYYFTRGKRDENYIELDFGILQASVSDSEAVSMFLSEKSLQEANTLAKTYIDEGNPKELMPYKYIGNIFDTPINAYRWFSLYSKKGDDDFFSSYLSDDELKTSFGKMDKPLLVLYSGADEYVPSYIDKKEVMTRFENATTPGMWSQFSKIVEGGTHALDENSEQGAMEEAVFTIIKFINSL